MGIHHAAIASGEPAAPVPVVIRDSGRLERHNIRYVLGFGIAAVMFAFVIVYVIYVG